MLGFTPTGKVRFSGEEQNQHPDLRLNFDLIESYGVQNGFLGATGGYILGVPGGTFQKPY